MGVDLYAENPGPGLPRSEEWPHPMMSWRLWHAFASLLEEVGADTSVLTFDNTGRVPEDVAKQWAGLLRPVADRTRRYVRGPRSWFEVVAESGDSPEPVREHPADAARQRLFASVGGAYGNEDTELEPPEETARWLHFVADYLEHSGGCVIG